MSQILASQLATPLPIGPSAVGPSQSVIPLSLDFTTVEQYQINLQNTGALATFGSVQSIYIDTSGVVNPLSIFFPVSGQTITVPAGRQGYFNVLCANPASIVFSCTVGSGIVPLELLNYQVRALSWSVN
jgi:hypothetical protein